MADVYDQSGALYGDEGSQPAVTPPPDMAPQEPVQAPASKGGVVRYLDESTGNIITMPDNLTPMERNRLMMRMFGQPEPRPQEFVQGSMEAQLGGPFVRNEAGNIQEFNQPGTRFDLARSNQLSEKIAKLQAKFPGMEVRQIVDPSTDENVIAVKIPGEQGYRLLDSEDAWTFSDLADAAGHVANAETLTTIAGAIATRGASLGKRVLGQIAGGTVGRLADIGVEAARGYENDPMGSIVKDAAISGILAGTGEFIFSKFIGGADEARRFIRSFGGVQLTDRDIAANQISKSMTGEPLPLGAVTEMGAGIENQAVMMDKNTATWRRAYLEKVINSIKAARDQGFGPEDFSGMSDEALQPIVNKATADLHAILGTTRDVSPEQAGRALSIGYKTWDEATRNYASRLYNKAFEIGRDVHLDLGNAKNVASDIAEGTQGRRTVKEMVQGPDGKPLVGADGNPVTVTKETFIQLREKNAELEAIIEKIQALDSNVTEVRGKSPYEQLKDLRTQLFDLKRATLGQRTIIEHDAGKLYDALSAAIENPVGGSAAFLREYEKANGTYRFYKTISEMTDSVRLARSLEGKGRPGDLASSMMVPGNEQTVRMLKWSLPENAWNDFADGFKTALRNDPTTLEARLNGFKRDPRVLRMVLGEQEEGLLRGWARQYKQLEADPVQQALGSTLDRQGRAALMLEKATPEQLAVNIDRSGGKASLFSRSLQAEMFNNIINSASKLEKGFLKVDANAIVAAVDTLERSGKLGAIMQDSQILFLKDARFLGSFLKYSADVGASMRRGETAAALTTSLGPLHWLHPLSMLSKSEKGLGTVGQNRVLGMILTNPVAREAILRTGSAQMAANAAEGPAKDAMARQAGVVTIRALTAISAELLSDLNQEMNIGARQ